ncbi:MAG TPA: phosphoglycolate phosphatase [Gammaproteobacteria bacterium]|nr:phosphoglycolate phosphatase [Gammaproteobacteria bacterium]
MTDTPALKAVLFDLDGTLVDTAPDLSEVLNTLLIHHGKPPQPYEAIRPHVSHGSVGMLGLGFNINELDPSFNELRKEFLDLYANELCHKSKLFPGMSDVLDELEQRDLPWGVVTNKPDFLTRPLLDELKLSNRCCCIISGDTLADRKPHPAPMYHAAGLAGSDPQHCVYVGDASRDIEAGNRAGMFTLIAMYGYLSDQDSPELWEADGSIEDPAGLLDWIDSHA